MDQLPTHLMWQARWVPSEAHGLDNANGEPVCVEFNPDPLAGDLVWGKDDAMQPSGEGVTLEGATIIAPLSGDQLAASLRDYAKTDVNNDNLERIEQTQALGQSLGGLNDLLLRRTLGLCLPPVDGQQRRGACDDRDSSASPSLASGRGGATGEPDRGLLRRRGTGARRATARPRETEAEAMMPQPSDAFGQWSWATRPDLGSTPPTWRGIRPTDDRAHFSDGLALTEGLLRLRRR